MPYRKVAKRTSSPRTSKPIKKAKSGRKRIYKASYIKKSVDKSDAMAKQLKARATKRAKDLKNSLLERKIQILRDFTEVDLDDLLQKRPATNSDALSINKDSGRFVRAGLSWDLLSFMPLYSGEECIHKKERTDDHMLEEFIDLGPNEGHCRQEAGYTTLTPVSPAIRHHVRNSKSINDQFRAISKKMEALYRYSY